MDACCCAAGRGEITSRNKSAQQPRIRNKAIHFHTACSAIGERSHGGSALIQANGIIQPPALIVISLKCSRGTVRIRHSVHALVELFRPGDGPSAEEKLPVVRSAFHALNDNFRVRYHPALGVGTGEPAHLGRVRDLVKRRKLDPAQCFIECSPPPTAPLSTSCRRHLG